MNNAEKEVLKEIVNCAKEVFIFNGYQKFPRNFWDSISPEEKESFLAEYHEWNGEGSCDEDVTLDMIIMFMGYKLKETL